MEPTVLSFLQASGMFTTFLHYVVMDLHYVIMDLFQRKNFHQLGLTVSSERLYCCPCDV